MKTYKEKISVAKTVTFIPSKETKSRLIKLKTRFSTVIVLRATKSEINMTIPIVKSITKASASADNSILKNWPKIKEALSRGNQAELAARRICVKNKAALSQKALRLLKNLNGRFKTSNKTNGIKINNKTMQAFL